MAVVVIRTTRVPYPSNAPWDINQQICAGLKCGEDIAPGAPCFIGADDLVYMCGGSGVTALTDPGASIDGFATERARFAQRDAVTLVDDLDWGLLDKTGANALPSGTKLYLDCTTAVKGRFNTLAAPLTGQKPCGKVQPGGRARLFNNR